MVNKLSKLIKELSGLSRARAAELRENGKSDRYKELHKEYNECLHALGKATEEAST